MSSPTSIRCESALCLDRQRARESEARIKGTVHTNDIWVLLIHCGVLCDSRLSTDKPDRQLSSLHQPAPHPTALSRSKKAHNNREFVHGPDAWAITPRAILAGYSPRHLFLFLSLRQRNCVLTYMIAHSRHLAGGLSPSPTSDSLKIYAEFLNQGKSTTGCHRFPVASCLSRKMSSVDRHSRRFSSR